MDKPVSILLLSPFLRPNIGGVETHLDDLCEYLKKRKYQVYVITYQPLTTNVRTEIVEKSENVEIHRIPWIGRVLFHKLEPYPLLEFIYLTPMLLVYSLLFMFRHGKEVDVLHAHGLNAAFAATVLAKVFKKRSVVSIHAIYYLDKRPMLARLIKITLSSFDVILTLANKSKVELARAGLNGERIRVFTYWIDQTVFKPLDKMECKKKLGWEDKLIALFVGRFIEIKGIRLLIEVAKRLSVIDDIYFAFIGGGPLTDEVKAASKSLRNVICVGSVDNKNLDIYYNASDIVIVPSLYDEGFGRVILEALSCGTPVIASKSGGIPEALDSSVGVLIEPTINNIKERVMYFHNNPSVLLKLARNCRKYAEERFSEKNAPMIEKNYMG